MVHRVDLCGHGMTASDNGDYVHYDDYEKLRAEVERMEAELARLKVSRLKVERELEAEVERLTTRECYVVLDYDCVSYAGLDVEEARKALKGFQKVQKWVNGKHIYEGEQ